MQLMAARRRLYRIVLAAVGMIVIIMLLVQVRLSNELLAHVGRIFQSKILFLSIPNCNVKWNREDLGVNRAPPVWANVEKCDDLLCKKYLTQKEWPLYNLCVKETNEHPKLACAEGPLREENPTPCTFYNGTAKKGTSLLVSYQGSGNTWLRGLLQQVTGVCAGSYVCDVDLRRHGFPGEGIYGEHSYRHYIFILLNNNRIVLSSVISLTNVSSFFAPRLRSS